MARCAVLIAYFLLISMTQVFSQDCGEVSVTQNPSVLHVRKEKDLNFTCTVTSSCSFTGYVKFNGTILARITANEKPWILENITIIGRPSVFTVIVKNPAYGMYYCGAVITTQNISVKILGSGTHIRSGGPSLWTKTGIVFSILCACVGMITKQL